MVHSTLTGFQFNKNISDFFKIYFTLFSIFVKTFSSLEKKKQSLFSLSWLKKKDWTLTPIVNRLLADVAARNTSNNGSGGFWRFPAICHDFVPAQSVPSSQSSPSSEWQSWQLDSSGFIPSVQRWQRQSVVIVFICCGGGGCRCGCSRS